MNRVAPLDMQAHYSLLQLALPGKAPRNIGIFLLDAAEGRLYKKLRRDWRFADKESQEILTLLDTDFDGKIVEMGGEVFLENLEDSLSNFLSITEREPVTVSNFEAALNRLFEQHVQRTEVIEFVTHVPLYSLRAAATKFTAKTWKWSPRDGFRFRSARSSTVTCSPPGWWEGRWSR